MSKCKYKLIETRIDEENMVDKQIVICTEFEMESFRHKKYTQNKGMKKKLMKTKK